MALLAAPPRRRCFHLPVETIGSKFGGISRALPPFTIPAFRADLIVPLLPSALTVAILAALESLLSAVVADSMSGDRHNSNAELVAQGFANIATPLFGGIPVTGAIARTATNLRSGAKTPVAGMIHALTLLGVILVLAPLAKFIPMATLAAVLFVVSYNMGEWREIGSILRLGAADRSVWFITFALTVMADLTVAVEVGMALASLLYIYRVAQTTTVGVLTAEDVEEARPHQLQDKDVPPYVTILRIHGPFLFGATEKLVEETADLDGYRSIVILRLRHMTAIDATGLHAFEVLSDQLQEIRAHAAAMRRAPPARQNAAARRFHRRTSARTTFCRMPRPHSNGRGKSKPSSTAWARKSRAITRDRCRYDYSPGLSRSSHSFSGDRARSVNQFSSARMTPTS